MILFNGKSGVWGELVEICSARASYWREDGWRRRKVVGKAEAAAPEVAGHGVQRLEQKRRVAASIDLILDNFYCYMVLVGTGNYIQHFIHVCTSREPNVLWLARKQARHCCQSINKKESSHEFISKKIPSQSLPSPYLHLWRQTATRGFNT